MKRLISKIFTGILFLFFTIRIFSQDDSNLFRPEPIYGEENAPETIYYKFVRNNISNTFLYTMFQESDFFGEDTIVIIIISLENNEGILLIYNNYVICQFSIIYNPSHLVPNIVYSLYWFKNSMDNPSYSDAQYFLLKQFDFNYKLIHKNNLEQVLDNMFPCDCEVYVDDFNRKSPYYIRRRGDD
jgi:hypothetical protein